ncbi:DUF3263 domain-containing protein [Rhodococcus koreensis]
MIAFERRWYRHGGGRADAIRTEFGLPPAMVFRRLEDFLETDPPDTITPSEASAMLRVPTPTLARQMTRIGLRGYVSPSIDRGGTVTASLIAPRRDVVTRTQLAEVHRHRHGHGPACRTPDHPEKPHRDNCVRIRLRQQPTRPPATTTSPTS